MVSGWSARGPPLGSPGISESQEAGLDEPSEDSGFGAGTAMKNARTVHSSQGTTSLDTSGCVVAQSGARQREEVPVDETVPHLTSAAQIV